MANPVCLILDPRHELEALGMAVDGDLNIIIVESPGPVIVILYHAADRNVKLQFAQHTQRDVHLSAAAVHEDQVWEPRKASEASIRCFRPVFLVLSLLFQLLHAMVNRRVSTSSMDA